MQVTKIHTWSCDATVTDGVESVASETEQTPCPTYSDELSSPSTVQSNCAHHTPHTLEKHRLQHTQCLNRATASRSRDEKSHVNASVTVEHASPSPSVSSSSSPSRSYSDSHASMNTTTDHVLNLYCESTLSAQTHDVGESTGVMSAGHVISPHEYDDNDRSSDAEALLWKRVTTREMSLSPERQDSDVVIENRGLEQLQRPVGNRTISHASWCDDAIHTVCTHYDRPMHTYSCINDMDSKSSNTDNSSTMKDTSTVHDKVCSSRIPRIRPVSVRLYRAQTSPSSPALHAHSAWRTRENGVAPSSSEEDMASFVSARECAAPIRTPGSHFAQLPPRVPLRANRKCGSLCYRPVASESADVLDERNVLAAHNCVHDYSGHIGDGDAGTTMGSLERRAVDTGVAGEALDAGVHQLSPSPKHPQLSGACPPSTPRVDRALTFGGISPEPHDIYSYPGNGSGRSGSRSCNVLTGRGHPLPRKSGDVLPCEYTSTSAENIAATSPPPFAAATSPSMHSVITVTVSPPSSRGQSSHIHRCASEAQHSRPTPTLSVSPYSSSPPTAEVRPSSAATVHRHLHDLDISTHSRTPADADGHRLGRRARHDHTHSCNTHGVKRGAEYRTESIPGSTGAAASGHPHVPAAHFFSLTPYLCSSDTEGLRREGSQASRHCVCTVAIEVQSDRHELLPIYVGSTPDTLARTFIRVHGLDAAAMYCPLLVFLREHVQAHGCNKPHETAVRAATHTASTTIAKTALAMRRKQTSARLRTVSEEDVRTRHGEAHPCSRSAATSHNCVKDALHEKLEQPRMASSRSLSPSAGAPASMLSRRVAAQHNAGMAHTRTGGSQARWLPRPTRATQLREQTTALRQALQLLPEPSSAFTRAAPLRRHRSHQTDNKGTSNSNCSNNSNKIGSYGICHDLQPSNTLTHSKIIDAHEGPSHTNVATSRSPCKTAQDVARKHAHRSASSDREAAAAMRHPPVYRSASRSPIPPQPTTHGVARSMCLQRCEASLPLMYTSCASVVSRPSLHAKSLRAVMLEKGGVSTQTQYSPYAGR